MNNLVSVEQEKYNVCKIMWEKEVVTANYDYAGFEDTHDVFTKSMTTFVHISHKVDKQTGDDSVQLYWNEESEEYHQVGDYAPDEIIEAAEESEAFAKFY